MIRAIRWTVDAAVVAAFLYFALRTMAAGAISLFPGVLQ